jgi:predicted HTH transcriptional regulator
MSTVPTLHITEEFARFLEAPSRDRLRELLRRRSGEYDFLDFKERWPEKSKLARHILAFANSGSGCLVIGVGERDDKTLDVKGMDAIQVKTQLKDSVKKFLPESIAYEILDFEYSESEYAQLVGKKFQVLLVVHNPDIIPALALVDGAEVNANRIYVRKNNKSTEADHSDLQELIRIRLKQSMQTPASRKLQEHLAELESLYERLPPSVIRMMTDYDFSPKKDLYRFLDRLIDLKKKAIEKLLEG